jgi:hypothetical protein
MTSLNLYAEALISGMFDQEGGNVVLRHLLRKIFRESL